MNRSKKAASPAEGIYYVVPSKSGHVSILSERDDGFSDPAHMFFWEKILRHLSKEFSVDLNPVSTNYMGLPRGRVQKEIDTETFQPTGRWVVLHGNDVPLSTIKYAVLQDFGLLPLSSQGKVVWKEEPHEKMDPADVSEVRKILKRR